MNIYISCSSADLEEYIESYSHIREEVLRLGHEIPADWLGRIIRKAKQGKNDLKAIPDIKDEGIKAIEKTSCLIADVSIPSSSVGYQIAYALSKKVPTLCLYSEEFGRKSPPQIIDATNSSLLRVESYNNKSLNSVIRKFFKDLPSEKLIKFNFIITPEIEEYIDKGAKRLEVSKSEFLREKVVDLIKADPNYTEKE